MILSSPPLLAWAIQTHFDDMSEICTAKVEVDQKFIGGSRCSRYKSFRKYLETNEIMLSLDL